MGITREKRRKSGKFAEKHCCEKFENYVLYDLR